MKKHMKHIIFILLISILIPNMVAAGPQKTEEGIADMIFFQEVMDLIQEKYPFEIKEEDLIISAVKGMLNSLDDYSDYYTKEEADQMFTSLNGNFSGIGVYINEKEGYINVDRPIKNGPAEKAGIKAGDLITTVDDLDIKDMGSDKASQLIKGPTGTKVKLGVLRNGTKLEFNIKRANIEIIPVEYEIMENNIGYIRLEEFSTPSTIEVKKALNEFDKKAVKKVILDLRDNPGGYLDQAISIGELFVPKGDIVHVRDKNNKTRTYKSKLEKTKYDLVVLVNERSASASEILAGAIKDRKAGKIVGTATFGKDLVQSLITVNDGSLVKLTTSVYLTPNKERIYKVGIKPDIEIENDGLEDLQLMKALEILKDI